MPRIPIDSLADTRLDPYRLVRFRKETRWSNRFIAEGKRVTRRLVESDFEVESLLVSERREKEFTDCTDMDFPTFVIPQAMADYLVGFHFHAGVMGCGRRKPMLDFEALLQADTSSQTFVACSRVNQPENMGTIIRLCAGFGANALLVGRGGSDPFSRRALRVSMGTALSLPIAQCDDLSTALRRLQRDYGFSVIGTVLDDQAEPLESAKAEDRQILLFGNETDGLQQEEIGLCNRTVTIPMYGNTDSLNVGNAAAIFLYHFTRQRPLG